MSSTQVYLAVALIVFAALLLILFLYRRVGGRAITPLASIAMALVIASVLFGENRLIGYSLLGLGVLLAVIDIFRRSRQG
ncbi:MAG: hypothetical protein ACYC4R_05985 [Anaerolineae bacterium]